MWTLLYISLTIHSPPKYHHIYFFSQERCQETANAIRDSYPWHGRIETQNIKDTICMHPAEKILRKQK